jgi:hypothetical protein
MEGMIDDEDVGANRENGGTSACASQQERFASMAEAAMDEATTELEEELEHDGELLAAVEAFDQTDIATVETSSNLSDLTVAQLTNDDVPESQLMSRLQHRRRITAMTSKQFRAIKERAGDSDQAGEKFCTMMQTDSAVDARSTCDWMLHPGEYRNAVEDAFLWGLTVPPSIDLTASISGDNSQCARWRNRESSCLSSDFVVGGETFWSNPPYEVNFVHALLAKLSSEVSAL